MKNTTQVVPALLCLLLTFSGTRAFAQSATAPFTHQGLTASTGDYLGFLQYKPADYDLHPNTKYPLIIFLHGIGERGNGTTELDKVAYVGLPNIIYRGNKMNFTWNGKSETFVVLAPQCPVKYGMWPAAFVNDLIAYAKQNLHIDPDRIYLTGLSMGGGGSLRYISDALPDNAKNIAAVATIAAPCTFRTGQYAAEAHLPVWCFHAEDDPTASVQCTKNAIAGLKQWNPSPKPLLDLWPAGGHVVWDRVYTDTNYKYQGIVNIYEWFLAQNRTLPVNQLPVADAGPDKSITGTTIVLDASRSTDKDGRLVRYVWRKLSGPSGGKIVLPMSGNSSTTFAGITLPGKYTFEVAVVDNRAAFTRDTVTITVNSLAAASPVPEKDIELTPVRPGGPSSGDNSSTANSSNNNTSGNSSSNTNKAPTANAGADVLTNTGWPQSMINAGQSKDADGWIAKVRWTKLSGPAQYSIDDSTKLLTYARNLTVGVYTFRVTVTDNEGASASDDMTITVNAPAPKPVIKNLPPHAMAGADVVTNTGWPQSLINACGSRDPDGWITKVRWYKVSGPSQYSIDDTTQLQTYARNLVEGAYTFRVIVTDNNNATSSADMHITVVNPYVKPINSTAKTASSATTVTINSIVSSVTIGNGHGITEIAKVNSKEGLSNIGPNPASGTLQLQLSSKENGRTNISIYDLNGRVIKNIMASKSQAILQQTIFINDLAPGVYYASAKTGLTGYAPIKFIKQ